MFELIIPAGKAVKINGHVYTVETAVTDQGTFDVLVP
jgi:hypothetical protein